MKMKMKMKKKGEGEGDKGFANTIDSAMDMSCLVRPVANDKDFDSNQTRAAVTIIHLHC